MATTTAVAEPDFSRKSIRALLKAYPDAAKLAQHPLAALPAVAALREQAAFADDTVGTGVALRKLIETAVSQLKPTSADPNYAQPAWRSFAILHDQFLNKRQAKAIRDMLGVSESGYFVDQRRGFDALTAKLQESEEWRMPGTGAASPARFVSPAANLPSQPTPFIGREDEIAQVTGLLEQAQLVTLVGPGGMGKTRLSIELASRLQSKFAEGVYFVPLTPINSAETLIPTIADALGLQFDSREAPREQLHNFLRHKQVLLVLDNFEHLVNAASTVADLLSVGPGVKVIATSRERLGLRSEHVFPVSGLSIPELDTPLSGHSAIDLFIGAAQRADVGFYFEETTDRQAVMQICRLVDGLPLGIELSASWVAVMPLAEIVTEIGRNLDFLGGTFRDAPDRHQSLRAVFEHSWTLLSAEEQTIFSRLATFANSFSRDAARATAQAGAGHLFTLQRKSLVTIEPGGRYAIHNLLRQYAREKLRENSAEYSRTYNAYCDHFITLLTQEAANLRSGNQPAAMRSIQHAFEDILNAGRWAIRQNRIDDINALAPQLHLAYEMARRFAEGAETFRELAAHWRDTPNRNDKQQLSFGLALGLRARFLYKLGSIGPAQRLFDQSLVLLDRIGPIAESAFRYIALLALQANPITWPSSDLYADCLDYFERQGDSWALAMAHYERAARIYDAPRAGSHRESQALMQQSLQLRQQIGDRWGVAACLHHLGHSSYGLGSYDAAEAYTQQSLAIYRDLDYAFGVGDAYNSLGQLAGTQGNYSAAIGYYESCLDIWHNLGTRWRIAECLDSLGFIVLLQGDVDSAESYYQESLAISKETDDGSGTAWSLHNLGDVARQRGDYEKARQLYMQSIEQHEARDPLNWGRLVSLYKLGLANALLGANAEAERNFRTAFAIAKRTKRYREAMDALLGLAQLRSQQGNSAEANRLLAFILHHPATAKETLELATQFSAEVELSAPDSLDLDALHATLTTTA